MLTQDEIDRLKQVAQAIAQRAYDELDKMPNVFPLMMMASCGICWMPMVYFIMLSRMRLSRSA